MTSRNVISDELRERIEPLLPSRALQRGGRWREHRVILEGIAWRFRTGSPLAGFLLGARNRRCAHIAARELVDADHDGLPDLYSRGHEDTPGGRVDAQTGFATSR